MTMKPIIATITVAAALLSMTASAQEEEASAGGPPEDGFVSRPEVCSYSQDVLNQPLLYKPWGSTLLISPTLPLPYVHALEMAAAVRANETGGKALWRLQPDDGTLDVDGQGVVLDWESVVVASCAMGDQGTSRLWTGQRPVGALGVVWEAFATQSELVYYLAGALRGLEGVGAHDPNAARLIQPKAPR